MRQWFIARWGSEQRRRKADLPLAAGEALVAEFLALPEEDSVPEEKKDENEGSDGSSVPNAPTNCPVSTPAIILTWRPQVRFRRARLGSK